MSKVEVFKTDVCNEQNAAQLLKVLKASFPDLKITFDLEDKDNILRVESYCEKIESGNIIEILQKNDQYCEILNQ